MHGDDIGITFYHIHTVFLRNGLLGLEKPVEFMVLMIDIRIGRIDILLLHAFRTGIQQSSAKGHHPAADIQPGEDDATSITVVETFLTLNA